MERLAETIAACATELKAVGMTSSAAAYRATVFTGLAKLAELLPPEQLHSDLVRIRAYLDDLLGDEPRHSRTRTTTIRTSSALPDGRDLGHTTSSAPAMRSLPSQGEGDPSH